MRVAIENVNTVKSKNPRTQAKYDLNEKISPYELLKKIKKSYRIFKG
ncbi:hypothetical protein SAMN02744133_105201 [Thalassospira xiamenensis M-5 = DSM 17429]|nr:hypothetical protein SAMN02744133_105201 [Thalassospira xiamenensis M-5 = DSM 17429]